MLFRSVVVAVLANPRKAPLLGTEERVAVIRASVDGSSAAPDRVLVATFDGLTVDAVRAHGGRAIIRGLRAISDFEIEMQLAHNNRRLAPDIDTVFFMTAVEHGYVSSSLVKEIAGFGGDIGGMVPPPAAAAVALALSPR